MLVGACLMIFKEDNRTWGLWELFHGQRIGNFGVWSFSPQCCRARRPCQQTACWEECSSRLSDDGCFAGVWLLFRSICLAKGSGKVSGFAVMAYHEYQTVIWMGFSKKTELRQLFDDYRRCCVYYFPKRESHLTSPVFPPTRKIKVSTAYALPDFIQYFNFF